jgi:hypothetical protein
MDDDLTTLQQVLRDRGAEVPHLQEAPPRMLVRARRRVARNAVAAAVAAGIIIVGASAGLAGLRASSSGLGGSSPTPTPSTSACTAGALQATAKLDGAAGSLIGSIDVTNRGDGTCTLEGYPSVTLTAPSGALLSLDVQQVDAQWQADQAPSPTGWPVVALRPGSAASTRLSLSNVCPQLVEPPRWTIDLTDGRGSLEVAGADSIPTCSGDAEPARLEVGPFEPGGEG